jgi:hypothetical protein
VKKIVDIPLIIEMSEWHAATELLDEVELKVRLQRALTKEFQQIDHERRCAEYSKELAEEHNKNLNNATVEKTEEDAAS